MIPLWAFPRDGYPPMRIKGGGVEPSDLHVGWNFVSWAINVRRYKYCT